MKTFQKKICLLGDFAVGKSSLVRRYVEGIFDDKYLTTVGVVVSRKSVIRPNRLVSLMIWDLAGGRDFTQTAYLAGIAGALLVCDLTRHTTLAAYRMYAQQVKSFNPNAELILIANKFDLVEERAISDEELRALSSELCASLFITSAKTGDMVELAFEHLADSLTTRED